LNWNFLPSVVNRAHVLFPSQLRSEVGEQWRETERKTQRDTKLICTHHIYNIGEVELVSFLRESAGVDIRVNYWLGLGSKIASSALMTAANSRADKTSWNCTCVVPWCDAELCNAENRIS
jgi:hypothetical protein